MLTKIDEVLRIDVEALQDVGQVVRDVIVFVGIVFVGVFVCLDCRAWII